MEQLISSVNKSVEKLLILPIYSELAAVLQAKIYEKAEEGARKCIVATNIAETSLTVDGIFHVIDTGYGKMKVYNLHESVNSMHQSWLLGTLNNVGHLIDDFGWKMLQFPLDTPLAKMLLMGERLRYLKEVLIIVSMLPVQSIFFNHKRVYAMHGIGGASMASCTRSHVFLCEGFRYTSLQKHRNKQKQEKTAMDEEMEKLRKKREARHNKFQCLD